MGAECLNSSKLYTTQGVKMETLARNGLTFFILAVVAIVPMFYSINNFERKNIFRKVYFTLSLGYN